MRSLLDRILREPELRDQPPVLVDVGAAGGVPKAWRRIAPYAIGIGFEPDAREAGALAGERHRFHRWIFCPVLAAPQTPPGGVLPMHLTQSPQCSSSLMPRADRLAEWLLAGQFRVQRTVELPAASLLDALAKVEVAGIDWLKCDTQGTDLRLFRSLPAAWRQRLLLAEFEPGFIDAYLGEDRLCDVLAAMNDEPFWLAGLDVGWTPRGRPALFRGGSAWHRRLAPPAPGWAGLRYLRDVAREGGMGDRRALLLLWVFAMEVGQPGYALTVAAVGEQKFDGIFADMAEASRRAVTRAMVRNFPRWLWERLARRG